MKKSYLFLVLIIFVCSFIYSETGEQEEIDYLLFLPNSAGEFADPVKAGAQLDNVARYLRAKTLHDAQIYVYGYSADVPNEIDPVKLSQDRALYVISELQKRGISRNFFTNPVGYGSVNLWGNNANEESRSPNRRVRILFEDIVITPIVVEEAEEEIIAFETAETEIPQIETVQESGDIIYERATVPKDKNDDFNWWWLLLLLLPLLLLLWPKRKPKKIKREKPPVETPSPIIAPVTESKPDPLPVITTSQTPVKKEDALIRPEGGEPKYYRLTEEEIRNKAYEIFEQRNYLHGLDEADWHNAISQLFAKYEAQGYIVIWP